MIQWCAGAFIAAAPKFRWCVLRGFPDYEDNSLAIYDRLGDYACSRVIWVVSDLSAARPFTARPGTTFVRRGSPLDYFYSAFAKYVFITHGHFIEKIPANQVCVNLWHGIPYKVIGKLDGKSGREDSLVVATSELTREVFSRVFGIGTERVVVTGQARTDRMFVDPIQTKARLRLEIDDGTKIFLWLPTYRKTNIGECRQDGRESENIFNCAGFPVADFDAYLKANNAICLVKPHPMAAPVAESGTGNLLYIDDRWLHSKNLTLYQLVGGVDCLISDISSIVVDFLLLDKPVVLLFEDIAEYSTSRGFVFAPIGDWLPARVNTGYSGFMDDIAAVLAGDDRYAPLRERLKHEFFAQHDEHSAARILDLVFHGDAVRCAARNLQQAGRTSCGASGTEGIAA
jgi:CDP-glycerol glycerophosphotransferase (TagB/SpsB family)